MTSQPEQLTVMQRIGCALFAISLFLCSLELAPGWGRLQLGWPPEAFYGVMALTGAIAGGLIPKNRFAGIPSGTLAGVGALYAQALVLANVAAISNVFLLLAAALGMLPGIGLYHGLRFLFSSSPATFKEQMEADDEAPATPEIASAGLDETSEIPKSCPVCKSESFRKKQSDAYLAILPDRVCLDCGTRYAPATPRWAGFVYLLCALVAFVCSAGIMIFNQLGAQGGQPRLGNEVVIAVIAAVLGIVCVVQGLRCLFWPAPCKVIDGRKGTAGEM